MAPGRSRRLRRDGRIRLCRFRRRGHLGLRSPGSARREPRHSHVRRGGSGRCRRASRTRHHLGVAASPSAPRSSERRPRSLMRPNMNKGRTRWPLAP
ncbi:hypothetical protein NS283_09935 [Microbacterium testaceum]|nr:hypothetical protein NS283_09935 [Microbacterium testaceum]